MLKGCNCEQHVTLDDYKRLSPYAQGYIVYMQAEHPRSELRKHQDDPYPPGSAESQSWNSGRIRATLDIQESEE